MASLGLGASQAGNWLPAHPDQCPTRQCPQELWGGACPLLSSSKSQHALGLGPQHQSGLERRLEASCPALALTLKG